MRRWRLCVLFLSTVLLAVGLAATSADAKPVLHKPLPKPVRRVTPEAIEKRLAPKPKPPAKPTPPEPPPPPPAPKYPALPPDSGTGRRIVYAIQQQRVWIVEGNEETAGSWLVSGRLNAPDPGTYSIYSRSRHSQSSNGSVTFEFMLRFHVASTGNAIGFHSIPVDRNGQPIQSEEELGQPRSRGCVRQKRSDAEFLWNWAPDGTTVRVTP